METAQENVNKKRRCDNVESSDEPTKLTKIGDLNDFCLLHICEHLDVQSLLNVADTDKRLRSAAVDVYKRKFGTKTVNLGKFQIKRAKQCAAFKRDGIRVDGLKTCLQYLRCFGPFIDGLSIGYDKTKSDNYKYVQQYVNDYCAANLVRIGFDGMPSKVSIEQFQKDFANIEIASFENSNFGKNWPSFVERFRNLRSLSFDQVRMVYYPTTTPFPNLEHLKIADLDCDGFIVENLLSGTHRLKSFESSDSEYETTFNSIRLLLDLIKDSPTVVKLKISNGFGSVTSADIQRFVSEHAALTELGLQNFTFTPNDAITITRQLNSLKEFQFHTQVKYCSEEHSGLLETLEKEWNVHIGDTGCFMPTMMYDMDITVNRREQQQ